MPLLSRRLDQIIARRRHARPKDRARALTNLKHQLDGITDALPTTEGHYVRTPFIYDYNPPIVDIPLELDNIPNHRAVHFGTITEYPLDNLPHQHPRLTRIPPSELPDWNRLAPVILEFIEFIDAPWNEETTRQVLDEYWNQRYQPAPRLAVAAARREAARVREGLHYEEDDSVPEEIEVQQEVVDIADAFHQEDSTLNEVTANEYEIDSTTSTTVASTNPNNGDHPSDENTTNYWDDSSTEESTQSKRQRRFNQYTPGPCVACTFNNSFCHTGGALLNTAIFGTTLFTHLDTSGRQFPILPEVDYHFNDVTVSLRENRTGLNILAVCPELIDLSNLQDTTVQEITTIRNLVNVRSTQQKTHVPTTYALDIPETLTVVIVAPVLQRQVTSTQTTQTILLSTVKLILSPTPHSVPQTPSLTWQYQIPTI